MSVGVGLEGDDQLIGRLAHARAGILDLSDVNRSMGQLVDTAATVTVPRATGGLAASEQLTVTGTGWGITYGKPYAVPVHWGTRYMRPRPWLMEAARSTEDRQLDLLTRHVQELLD